MGIFERLLNEDLSAKEQPYSDKSTRHKGMEYVGKLNENYPSFLHIKKLSECNWDNDELAKKTALECFNYMLTNKHKDDEMAQSFLTEMKKSIKSVCDSTISSHMSNKDDSVSEV
jgi:hypothetical protein